MGSEVDDAVAVSAMARSEREALEAEVERLIDGLREIDARLTVEDAEKVDGYALTTIVRNLLEGKAFDGSEAK